MNEGFDLKIGTLTDLCQLFLWIPHGRWRHGPPYSFQEMKVSTLAAEACVAANIESRCIGCTDFNHAGSETINTHQGPSRNSRNHSPAPCSFSLMGHHVLSFRRCAHPLHGMKAYSPFTKLSIHGEVSARLRKTMGLSTNEHSVCPIPTATLIF